MGVEFPPSPQNTITTPPKTIAYEAICHQTCGPRSYSSLNAFTNAEPVGLTGVMLGFESFQLPRARTEVASGDTDKECTMHKQKRKNPDNSAE